MTKPNKYVSLFIGLGLLTYLSVAPEKAEAWVKLRTQTHLIVGERECGPLAWTLDKSSPLCAGGLALKYNWGSFPQRGYGLFSPRAWGDDKPTILPEVIEGVKAFSGTNVRIEKNTTLKKGGILIFGNNAHVFLSDGISINLQQGSQADTSAHIIINHSVFSGRNANINTAVLLENSALTLEGGKVTSLWISGTSDIAVSKTEIGTLTFDRSLGATKINDTDRKNKKDTYGVGFLGNKIGTLDIDVTGMSNKAVERREVYIKDSEINSIVFSGFITGNSDASKYKLYTHFNLNGIKKVKKFTYTDANRKSLVVLPNNSLGVLNFQNSEIAEANISFNLLRDVTFNGVSIDKLNLLDVDKAPKVDGREGGADRSASGGSKSGEDDHQDKKSDKKDHEKDNKNDPDKSPPTAPKVSNLQLMGKGELYVKDFNASGAKFLQVQGETAGSYNGQLSDLRIFHLLNADQLYFSFYNLKNVVFGLDPEPKDDPKHKEKDENKNESKDKDKKKTKRDTNPDHLPVGGKGAPINIKFLNNVTSLAIYNNTLNLDWRLNKTTSALDVWNVNRLILNNSLLDTKNIKARRQKLQRPGRQTSDNPKENSRNDDLQYDYLWEGETVVSRAYGFILDIENSGVIDGKVDGKPNFVPLNMKIKGDSVVTLHNSLSDVNLSVNGVFNIDHIIEDSPSGKPTPDEYKVNTKGADDAAYVVRKYHFHTSYDFEYLDPQYGEIIKDPFFKKLTDPTKESSAPVSSDGKGTNQPKGAKKEYYNYWEEPEYQRVEQNNYTFSGTNFVIANPSSQQYRDYVKGLKGSEKYSLVNFTYYQPYEEHNEDGRVICDGQARNEGTSGRDIFYDKDGKPLVVNRLGFPVEFGNKIAIDQGKLTLIQAIDNLTVLEVSKNGILDFTHMEDSELTDSWLSKLRMRGGKILLPNSSLKIDKLDIYGASSSFGPATFVPNLSHIKDGEAVKVIDQDRVLVNRNVDFHHNKLHIDVFSNNFFLSMNNTVDLIVLELGEYVDTINDGKQDEEDESFGKRKVIKSAERQNYVGVDLEQNLIFSVKSYWQKHKVKVKVPVLDQDGRQEYELDQKDGHLIWVQQFDEHGDPVKNADGLEVWTWKRKPKMVEKELDREELHVEVTRTHDVSDYVENSYDLAISKYIDSLADSQGLEVDKKTRTWKTKTINPSKLSDGALDVINHLWSAHNIIDIRQRVSSLAAVDNRIFLSTTINSAENIIKAYQDSNSFTVNTHPGSKFTFWSNAAMARHMLGNTRSILGINVNSSTYVIGLDLKPLKHFVFGGFLGMVNAHLSGGIYKGSSPSYGGGLDLTYSLPAAFTINMIGIAQNTQINMTRDQLWLGTSNQLATRAMNYYGQVELAKGIKVNQGVLIPYVIGGYGRSTLKGYSETGGSTALVVDGYRMFYEVAKAGLGFGKRVKLNAKASLVPKVGVEYFVRYNHNLGATTFRFQRLGYKDNLANTPTFTGVEPATVVSGISAQIATSIVTSGYGNIRLGFNASVQDNNSSNYGAFISYKLSF